MTISESAPWPSGFELAGEIRRCCGSVRFATRDQPPAFWAVPSGYIGPSLLKADLAEAQVYGKQHPEGWDYVVDTERVRVINPANIIWLRSIRSLPNIRRYIVIAPSRLVRLANRLGGWLVKPDMVLKNWEERPDDVP